MLKWSVLVYVVGVMVAVLHLHYTHRRMLTELQSVRTECSNFYCYYCCSGVDLSDLSVWEQQRETGRVLTEKTETEETERPCLFVCAFLYGTAVITDPAVSEQRTFLHLVPDSTYSYDERDTTVLSWAVGRSQGAGLQVSGDSITVVTEGSYFIYSQVLYKDPTWVMGHVITKRLKGAETKLMKCLKSMPNNVSLPLNTCYTAGIHFLESGSVLELSVPRRSAQLVISAQSTFMGIFSI